MIKMPRTDAELQEKWNELNVDETWGMTFDEFKQMIREGLHNAISQINEKKKKEIKEG
jgi:hypothetical protein